jgi:hypothetical protein
MYIACGYVRYPEMAMRHATSATPSPLERGAHRCSTVPTTTAIIVLLLRLALFGFFNKSSIRCTKKLSPVAMPSPLAHPLLYRLPGHRELLEFIPLKALTNQSTHDLAHSRFNFQLTLRKTTREVFH